MHVHNIMQNINEILVTLKKISKIIFLLCKLLSLRIEQDLIKEKQNLHFWYILTFAVGILCCFFCEKDYRIFYISLTLLIFLLSCSICYIFEKQYIIFIKFLLFFTIGFVAAFSRCIKTDENIFTSPEFNITIDGKIESIKLTSSDNIILLNVINSPNTELLDKRIRIKYDTSILQKQSINNGDIIRVKTSLNPIRYSIFPQDKSYENYAKFFNITASGRAKSIKILKQQKNDNNFFKKFDIQSFRNKIQKHIYTIGKQSAGAGITIAILTGNNSFIPKEQLTNIRRSGCAHILAISGLHMSIVVTFVFTIFIHFFALFTKIALRYNTKKIAVLPSILTCLFYLQIANVPISATRSFLMVLIAAITILLNRSKASLNALFVTFFIMLLTSPNYLLSPSFQMSFMAVFGLTTFYNNVVTEKIFFSKNKTICSYIFGIILSSIIATFSTVFFEIYHFKQYAWIGLVSNIPVIPMTEFLVLPFGFIGMLFNGTFFGDGCYKISIFFANIVCFITDWIANLSYSFLTTKQMTNSQLGLISFGMIIFYLSRSKLLKIISIASFLIGIFSYIKNPNFVLLYNKNLQNIVFLENSKYYSKDEIKNEYLYSVLSQNLGSEILPANNRNKSIKCTGDRSKKNMLCKYTINGISVSIKQSKGNGIIGVKLINNKPVFYK